MRTKEEFVTAVTADYEKGIENAFEAFIESGYRNRMAKVISISSNVAWNRTTTTQTMAAACIAAIWNLQRERRRRYLLRHFCRVCDVEPHE